MKLKRSRTNRMLAGVLGGMAESFGVNAGLLRIAFAILLLGTGFFPMAVLYLVFVFAISNKEGK